MGMDESNAGLMLYNRVASHSGDGIKYSQSRLGTETGGKFQPDGPLGFMEDNNL